LQPEVISLGEPMLEFNAITKGRLRDVNLFKRSWGGDTSNFAVAVTRLGGKAGYVCRVGDDDFGKCFLDFWRGEGVDTSHVIVEKGGFTGIYFISIIDGGEHDFTYYRTNSSASHLCPEDIDPSYIGRAKVFHTSGISQAISQSCREAVFTAIEIAKQSGVKFSYDPNVRLKLWPIHTARAVIMRTIELADIVMPSIEDMKILLGVDSPEQAADLIMKRGPKIVVVKLGSEGSFVAYDDEKVRVPGFKVMPVDTTGAGDAFDAAFMVSLLEGCNPVESAKFANAVGALTTLGKGAVEPIPKREEVYEFLKSSSR